MTREKVLLLAASFIISVALWFQVQPMFEPGREREFSIPLNFENRPDNLATFAANDAVTVVATGTLAELDKLDISQLEAYVNLESIREGEQNLPVQIRGPSSTTLSFRPKIQRVRVTAEPIRRSPKVVEVVTNGVPPDGLVYQDAVVQPSEVLLEGPESYFNQVETARVVLDLSRIRPGSTVPLAVEIVDAEGKPVPSMTADPSRVTVAASFKVSIASRSVPVIVDWGGDPAQGYQITEITVDPPKIELSGESALIGGITTVQTNRLSFEGIRQTKTMSATLKIPDGLNADTQTVEVTIRVSKR